METETMLVGNESGSKVRAPTKSKVEEVIFVNLNLPRPITRSTPLSEDETVVFDVLPDDLKEQLTELNSKFEYAIQKHVKPLRNMGLGYLKYPLKKHRDEVDKAVGSLMPEYETFVKKQLIPRSEEIAKRIQEFYDRHPNEKRASTPVVITDGYLYARFRPRITFAPFRLDAPFMFEAVSQDEKKAFEAEVRTQIEREARKDIDHRTAELLKAFQDAMAKLRNGKMVTASKIGQLQRLREEVYDALSVAEDADKYHSTFDLMVQIVDTLAQKHSSYRLEDSKCTKKAIVLETVDAARRIAAEGKPKLEEFKELVTETVMAEGEFQSAQDMHLKKLVDELTFE